MIGKDKLIYDGTTPADGDSVAAFLHATNKLTSTTVDAKEGLDVNVLNDIVVDLDGVYATTTNETPDNAGLIAHTRAATPGAAEQVKRTTAGPMADGVVNANVHGLDTAAFAMGFNGTTWDRIKAASGAMEVKLMAADASVALPVKDTAEAFLNTLKAVSSTGAVVVSALSGRRRILFQNQGNKAVYVGPSGVGNTGASTGLKVSAGANIEIPLGAGAALHAISESGTQNCVIMELA
jgi:hypothetical protein